MNREFVWTIIVSVCLLLTMVWPPFIVLVKADSRTIYVNASNVNDPSEDGSSSHPFDSIQEGVDAAGFGDTVQVAAGVYYESVQIAKSSFSLVGEKGSTIIDGNGTGEVGIRVYHYVPDYTENVSISGFTVRNFVRGMTLSRSIHLRLRDNSMVGNTYNFGDYTLQVHDIDTSNTVDGKPIYFWVNHRDERVPADAGYVALVNSTNMTVRDLNLTNNVQGLLLKNTTDSVVENVHILNNWDGMYLDRWSNNNSVTDSTISNNLFMGIYVSTSSGNIIANNSILDNAYGLLFDSTVYEVVLGNLPTGNTVRDNVVRGNTVANSSLDGVHLVESEDNVFYHNNFVNNTRQVYIVNSTDKWDDGTEGNYWNDYSGEDLTRDGVGDAPYVIDENNQDNHPLLGMFSDFKVTPEFEVTTVSNFTVSKLGFDYQKSRMTFDVEGENGTTGFCRIMIPRSLMQGPYSVMIDGKLHDSVELPVSNSTDAFLYFTYTGSVHNVTIVPELFYLYYNLLGNYTSLQNRFNDLQNDNGMLNSSYNSLRGDYDALNSTLQASINTLQEQNNSLGNQLNTILNVLYAFAALTVVLIITITYFATRKPKTRTEVETAGEQQKRPET